MGKAKYPHNSDRPESKAVLAALEAQSVEMMRIALSPRMLRFSDEYIIDFNATAACLRAGYAPANAMQQASSLLKNRGVRFLIDEATKSKESKALSVDPDYVIKKVIAIVTNADTNDGNKLRGLELLARHLGMFIERTEISGKDGEAIQIEKVQSDANDLESAIARLAKRGGADRVPGESLN